MGCEELAIHLHVGSGRAEIRGRTRAYAETAEQLDLYGDGEVLILGHGLWRLTVDHDSAVARGPARTARACSQTKRYSAAMM